MKRITILCLLFAGCGVDKKADNNNHGYGYSYDAIGAENIRIRYSQVMVAMPPSDAILLLETIYTRIEDCADIHRPGPLIIWVPTTTLKQYGIEMPTAPGTGSVGGYTFFDTGLILIAASSNSDPFVWAIPHNIIHYLLAMSGFPSDRNTAHDSPIFDLCAPL